MLFNALLWAIEVKAQNITIVTRLGTSFFALKKISNQPDRLILKHIPITIESV